MNVSITNKTFLLYIYILLLNILSSFSCFVMYILYRLLLLDVWTDRQWNLWLAMAGGQKRVLSLKMSQHWGGGTIPPSLVKSHHVNCKTFGTECVRFLIAQLLYNQGIYIHRFFGVVYINYVQVSWLNKFYRYFSWTFMSYLTNMLH